ncbi:MAG TPA: urate hydroxylase PuuD [Gemmatimonadaceae bacterium]|nr:urate hydroxylase PuuD [Gemmatimonadaceae bacterium]
MNGLTLELLDLIARWVHVIAAIMWAGNSLLFNWLDRSLVPANKPGQTRSPTGTIWLLHSGGFYYVEKTPMAGEGLPAPLHWFKWQAYTTWLSGVVLLIVVYYGGGRALMASPLGGLTHTEATLVGVGAISGGWLIYELMQRIVAPRMPSLSTVIWVGSLTAIAILLTRALDGRAAFLHVGAMLGTIMAGNVAMTIVPSQRELVASVSEGRGADPTVSARAKRVSIHNNYFTFPVIVLMVSSHFPAIYGSRWSWALLLLLIVAGATVRHVLNLRWTYASWKPALGATMAVSAIALWATVRAGAGAGPKAVVHTGPVAFAEVRHVIDRRCSVCHSQSPAERSFGIAPGGVAFDTPAEILSRADRIKERAVTTRTMPPANRTNMTDGERALLARWIAGGATGQ